MRQGTISFRGRDDKIAAIASRLGDRFGESVLDVGCDRAGLRNHVSGRYHGVDRTPEADEELDLEGGLPYADRSFDTVVALDVLEHLDSAHDVRDELFRVADKMVVIGLPNLYEWRFRVAYSRGLPPSGKYEFPPDAPEDRHRWITSLESSRQFVAAGAEIGGFQISEELLGYYDYRRPVARAVTAVGRSIGPRAAGLFAYHYTAAAERSPGAEGSNPRS